MGGGTVPLATLPGTILPAQQQPQQTAESMLGQLMQQRQAIDTQLQSITKGGAVPTSAAPSLPSPGLLLNPVHQHQDLPMDEREVVGRKAAKVQGIGNAISAAANVVGRFTEKVQEHKNRALAVDLERILTSVQGLQQAKDALQSDPNNAQAKALIDRNTKIINALLSDPKKQKSIAKALDVNFTNPEENKTPEHDALKQATKSLADQLQEQIPQQMQVNPQTAQQIQMLMQREQGIDKMISAVVPSQIRAEASKDVEAQRSETALVTAAAKIQADAAKTQAEIQARAAANQERIGAMKDIAQMREAGANARKQYGEQQANARLITGLTLREHLIEHRGLSGDKATAAKQKSYQLALKANTEATQQINVLRQERDQISKENPKNPALEDYNQNIQFWEGQLKTSSAALKSLQKDLGMEGGTISGTSTKSSESAAPTSVGQTADSDADENSDLYGIGSDNSEQ